MLNAKKRDDTSRGLVSYTIMKCITYHIVEQSKLTKSHLCGLKLNESANFRRKENKQ